jgi:hypothetical protein
MFTNIEEDPRIKNIYKIYSVRTYMSYIEAQEYRRRTRGVPSPGSHLAENLKRQYISNIKPL